MHLSARSDRAAIPASDTATSVGAHIADPRSGYTPPPPIETARLRAYIILMSLDFAALWAGFYGAEFLLDEMGPNALIPPPSARLLLPIYLTCAAQQRVYSIRALTKLRYAISRVLRALFYATIALSFLLYVGDLGDVISRSTLILGTCITFGALILTRILADKKLRQKWGQHASNIIVIADGGPALSFPGARFVNADEEGLSPHDDSPEMRQHIGLYLANQERVIVSAPAERHGPWAKILRAAGVDAQIVATDPFGMRVFAMHRYDDQGVVGLDVSYGPLGLRARMIKRAFDLAIASCALIIIGPIMCGVAVAVKLIDGGDVLFVQNRLGLGNRPFRMFKFRTMVMTASDQEGILSTTREDGRFTKIGRFLRRTSMDELPQLFNVLTGDMSLVGPRPHALASTAAGKRFWEVNPQYWYRHALQPGMTGLAQIRGFRGATRDEQDLEMRLQSDLEYISNWSLWRDVLILLRTLRVLRHENAY